VGHLQGAAVLTRDGTVKTPQALAELRQVYEYGQGGSNLIQVNLPGLHGFNAQSAFSNPEQAIERLENLLALGI